MYSAETLLKATLYLIFFGCDQEHMVTDVSMMTVDYILLAQHMYIVLSGGRARSSLTLIL
jgi:hypothetical protein